MSQVITMLQLRCPKCIPVSAAEPDGSPLHCSLHQQEQRPGLPDCKPVGSQAVAMGSLPICKSSEGGGATKRQHMAQIRQSGDSPR